MTRVLAFDIGIKNLAWCCIEKTTNKIIGWDNYNLMSESSNINAPKSMSCTHCKSKGVYTIISTTTTTKVCSRHCPVNRPALRDCSGNILKAIPSISILREIITKTPILNNILCSQKKSLKKDDYVREISNYYSIPSIEPKVSKAPDIGLTLIHNSLQKLVREQESLWKTCSIILLENQPAFKNPTMKSVQILLFATLRDLIHNSPPLKLVHAGKKVKVDEKGDAGYKDRKSASEARVLKFLKEHPQESIWDKKWSDATKKSDLADSLCMCLDA